MKPGRIIRHLIEIEEAWRANGSPRKFIKVHRAWDVRAFLQPGATSSLFESEQECGWCSFEPPKNEP